MKISVLMVSRGRPRMMAAVLSAFDHLASGEHDIRYAIACDEDDFETQHMASRLTAELNIAGVRIGPRPLGLGALHNELALDCPGDLYVLLGDDAFPLTAEWDRVAVETVRAAPVLHWWRLTRTEDCTHPIVPAAWHRIAGRFWSGYFPFWFDDMWLAEVWALATGLGPMRADCVLAPAAVRGETQRMRDLAFWYRFYHWTRPERLAEARRLRAGLGLKGEDPGDAVFAKMVARNAADLERVPEFTARFGDPRPADPRYLAARMRAESMMTNSEERRYAAV